MRWDPSQYARFSSERNRPFFDLLAQVRVAAPHAVVDLGCGAGDLTAALADRWPEATVLGLDSSPEMIQRATTLARHGLNFRLARAEEFEASGVDVLISNAMLQWVPDHTALLQRWATELNPGGWLAFAVPDNFDAPSHVLMRELAESPRWATLLEGTLRHADAVLLAEEYVALLANAGLSVNAWQTRYLHVLTGPDPVLEWVRGTGLRPVLQQLSESEAAEFEADFRTALRTAYPSQHFGTLFPFRRTFLIGHKPGGYESDAQ